MTTTTSTTRFPLLTAAPARRPRTAGRAGLCGVALAGLLILLAGCGDDDTTSAGDGGPSLASRASDAQTLDITVPGGPDGEYTLDADLDGLTAGPVTVTLTNHGTLEHQAMLLRLRDGQDAGSFAAAAAADPSGAEALSLVEGFGGPNGVAPGETQSTTQVLEDGDYVLICVIPDETGVPHAAHGMLVPFSVAAAEDGGPPPPLVEDSADADISLVDFGFSIDATFAPGDTAVVANNGDQGHELAIYQLGNDVTFEEAEAALRDPTSGPPPLQPAGGTGLLAPRTAAEITLPDEPGEYVIVCFVPDVTGDRQPHSAHGMVAELTLG